MDELNHVLLRADVASPRKSEASMIALPDGRLLLAYTDFFGGDPGDWGPARIAAIESRDGGFSWSAPVPLTSDYAKVNILLASLLLTRAGRIILAYNRVEQGGPDQPQQVIHLDCMISDDLGATWSRPRTISSRDTENMIGNDRLLQLSTGRILLPASGERSPVWISDDNGDSWRLGRGDYSCRAEPAVVELADGSVKLYAREGSSGPHRHLYVAHSRDGGETWGPPDELPLRSAAVPCAVQRVPHSDDLIMVWNNCDTRSNLSTAVSRDGGRTWSCFHSLEPMQTWPMLRSHCYPSLLLHGPWAHLTYWEADKHPQTGFMIHLIHRRLPLSWLCREPDIARRRRLVDHGTDQKRELHDCR
jgi:hypothetical protein